MAYATRRFNATFTRAQMISIQKCKNMFWPLSKQKTSILSSSWLTKVSVKSWRCNIFLDLFIILEKRGTSLYNLFFNYIFIPSIHKWTTVININTTKIPLLVRGKQYVTKSSKIKYPHHLSSLKYLIFLCTM